MDCKRAFIIGLDGAGSFVKAAHSPRIDAILQGGAYTYFAQTVFPTISAECWGALLHGVGPEKHGLNNDVADKDPFPEESPYPSFMKLARQTWPNCKLAAFSCWAPINTGIIERSSACHSISLPDPELAEAAAVYIQANSDLRIMFIQFDKIDTSGHEFGYGSQPFLNKITETDGYVGIILDAIHHAGLWDDSLIILTADHGGGGDNAYSHGSDHPLDMTIFWSCYGPGIIQGEMSSEVNIKDTSAVVATALGLPILEKWEAITPKGLFKNG